MKRLAGPLVALGCLVFLWASGEVVFRFVGEARVTSTDSNWHRPNTTYIHAGPLLGKRYEKPVAVHWNSLGWHDTEHAAVSSQRRVLVLGDSYVEAVQVDLDQAFFRILGRALQAETIAMGASGWGQVQEFVALEAGLSYGPSLVLAEFLPGNDIRNNNPELERLAGEDYTSRSLARRCFVEAAKLDLRFMGFVCERLDKLNGEFLDSEVYREKPTRYPDLWREAWKTTEQAVAMMRDRAREHGAVLAMVGFSSPNEIEAWAGKESPLDYTLPGRHMGEICERLGVPYLNLAEKFSHYDPATRAAVHTTYDGHWSAEGHALAAKEIAAWVHPK